jgi:hypothetical protein
MLECVYLSVIAHGNGSAGPGDPYRMGDAFSENVNRLDLVSAQPSLV